MLGNYQVATQLVASRVVFSSTQLVNCSVLYVCDVYTSFIQLSIITLLTYIQYVRYIKIQLVTCSTRISGGYIAKYAVLKQNKLN
jgi:hypothetical protein